MATEAISQHKLMAMGKMSTPKNTKTSGVRPDVGPATKAEASKPMPGDMPKMKK